MLAEILIYIGLFTALFSGAFTAAFQTIDSVRYLQTQKTVIDDLYFFQARLDAFIQSTSSWENLSLDTIIQAIPNAGLLIDSFYSKILDTATSSSQVLLLTLDINKKSYVFSYVREK